MQRIWCGRAMGAPMRSSAKRGQLAGRHPLADDIAQPADPVAAEERLVEVGDHIGDVDVVGVVDADDRLLGASADRCA